MKCDFLKSTLMQLAQCHPYGNGALVDTTCLFPSGKVVQVLVQQISETSFLVSDSGAAIDELEVSGVEIRSVDKLLRSYARHYGIKAEGGTLFEKDVSFEDLTAAIRMVANAAQETVAHELNVYKFRPRRELKELFSQFIKRNYRDEFTARIVEGKNKPHLFDYVHETGPNRLFIIDPVLRDSSSMNAHIVTHLDVRAANQNTIQYLVYDNQEDWTADQLGMLELAAKVVSFENVPDVLRQKLRS